MATKDDKEKTKPTAKKKPAAKSKTKKAGGKGLSGVIGTEHKKAKKLKISRKEMKTDELQEASAKIVNYLTAHGNGVLYMAGTVIGIVIITVIFNFYTASKRENASGLFTKARNLYNLALNEVPPSSVTLKGSLELFNSVNRSYKGTVEAALSDFYVGNIYFHLSEYKDSIAAYEKFLDSKVKNNTYKTIAKTNIAYCYKNQAEYDKAINLFKEISDSSEGYLKEISLYDLGMAYEKANKKDEAYNVYTDFVKNYPASSLLERVQERINTIQAK